MFHRVTLIGRVGQDPQMRYTPEGTPVTSFSVATTTRIGKAFRDGGERPCPEGWKESFNGRHWELTTWWNVSAWRGLGEMINQYVNKGMLVFVEGEVRGDAMNGSQRPRVWTSNDGVARASFELTARDIKFMSGRDESGGGAPLGEPPPEGFEEEALPF